MNTKIETPRLRLRCSSLPLLFRCHAAAQAPDLVVRQVHAAAESGTAVHTHLQRMVESGGRVDWDAVPRGEVRGLVAAGAAMWRELRDLFPDPVCEESLSAEVAVGVTLTGHTDVRSGRVGTARVLDWKSGRLDSDYREQLLGYAGLILATSPGIDRVETHIAWLREREVEHHHLGRAGLPEWAARVGRIGRPWSGSYTAGDHCEYCPRGHECQGRAAVIRGDARALLELEDEELSRGLSLMPPERVLELVAMARRVERVAGKVVAAARDHVTRCGDVVAADGRRLTVERQARRSVDAFAAWPVLMAELDDRELALCIDVSLTKVQDAVAKKAEARQGAAAKRALAEKLDEAGAIRVSETRVLKERRG